MTSLDYYAIEDLLTDDERAARDRTRRFVQEEVLHEIVVWKRAAVVQLTDAGSFDIPEASMHCE